MNESNGDYTGLTVVDIPVPENKLVTHSPPSGKIFLNDELIIDDVEFNKKVYEVSKGSGIDVLILIIKYLWDNRVVEE